MTKINKIFCDGCGEEIDVDTMRSIGLFEFIEVQEKIKLDLHPAQTDVTMSPEHEIKKIIKDLCSNCAKTVGTFLAELAKKNKVEIKG